MALSSASPRVEEVDVDGGMLVGGIFCWMQWFAGTFPGNSDLIGGIEVNGG